MPSSSRFTIEVTQLGVSTIIVAVRDNKTRQARHRFYVAPPNLLERWFSITWEDKVVKTIHKAHKKLPKLEEGAATVDAVEAILETEAQSIIRKFTKNISYE